RDVHDEQSAVWLQAVVDAAQHVQGASEVVHQLDGGDHVVLCAAAQLGQVADLEPGVREAPPLRLFPRHGDAVFREVVAGEPAPGEGPGHDVDRVARAGADVQDVRSCFQGLYDARRQR